MPNGGKMNICLRNEMRNKFVFLCECYINLYGLLFQPCTLFDDVSKK